MASTTPLPLGETIKQDDYMAPSSFRPEDNSAPIEDSNDPVADEDQQDAIFLEQIDIKFDQGKNETRKTKFERTAQELLARGETNFEDWVNEMVKKKKWDDSNCPIPAEKASKLKDWRVSEATEFGRKFNEVIEKNLGRKPDFHKKEDNPKRKKVRDPVYLFLGTQELDEFKKRLEIACKSFHGLGKDLNAIGTLLEDKQKKNKELRSRLKKCFEDFENLYKELGPDVQTLLALDSNTLKVIEKHKMLLDDDTCPIVVAGQVSSGKSSLLNLFLSAGGQTQGDVVEGDVTQGTVAKGDVTDEKTAVPFTLPVSTLACTGRVCEIKYSTKQSAKIYRANTKLLETIDIKELSEHVDMYGQDESYKADEKIRDVVKLGLPIPFLKGGITLVDTPGVGENTKDSEIVRNYVDKNNVFGFIFTIHTSAGSGVNAKFQQLLRDLSKYVDDNGTKKLDPEAVIFVCNFWDQIKKEEQESTIKRVLEILETTGFAKDFDCTKQLLFMSSKGAYDTWKVGYMSEDYSRLIDAMERFFEVGHKRKVMQSYVWFHALLQKVLRSVKFIEFWAQDIGPDTKNTFAEKLLGKLKKIKKSKEKHFAKLETKVPVSAERLAEKLLDYLKTQKDTMFQFSRNDVLNLEEFKDNADVQELQMDLLIDAQIGNILNKWEAENRLIAGEKQGLENGVSYVANEFDTRLSEFERHSISMDKFKEDFKAMDKREFKEAMQVVENVKELKTAKVEMDIAFGRTYGNALMKGCSVKQRAALEGSSIVTNLSKVKAKGRIKLLPRQAMSMYKQWKDMKDYLDYRAKTILSELMHKGILAEIMENHLCPIKELVVVVERAIDERIGQNETLINVMKTELIDMMRTKEKKQEFFERGSQADSLFSKLLKLGYQEDLEEVTFGPHNLKDVEMAQRFPCGRYGTIYNTKIRDMVTASRDNVDECKDMTVKVTNKCLTESDQFFLQRHLVKINEDQPLKHAPTFMGLAERGYGLVFKGQMMTAKRYFLQECLKLERAAYEKEIGDFLLKLADGIQYLHYKELVHPEVSVESVFVQFFPSVVPMLSNIAEKGPLKLELKETDELQNVIYLPPECIKPDNGDKLKSWYTSAGDMYGLGSVMVELFFRQENILEFFKKRNFQQWRDKTDQGQAIVFKAQDNDITQKLPEKWLKIIHMCLKKQPEVRLSADSWIREWVEGNEAMHQRETLNTFTQSRSPAWDPNALKSSNTNPERAQPYIISEETSV